MFLKLHRLLNPTTLLHQRTMSNQLVWLITGTSYASAAVIC